MKHGSTFFLKLVIYLIGIFVLALCVVALPLGIATDRTGMYWPILLGLYVPAIPFFFALYQARTLLGIIETNNVFTPAAVEKLTNIKLSAAVVATLFCVGMPYIYYVADIDDAPGVIAIAFVIVFASVVIATAAGLFQKLLQNAVDIKSENDLTV